MVRRVFQECGDLVQQNSKDRFYGLWLLSLGLEQGVRLFAKVWPEPLQCGDHVQPKAHGIVISLVE